jgi:hypothetical protein
LVRLGARSLGVGDGFVIAHQATGELAAGLVVLGKPGAGLSDSDRREGASDVSPVPHQHAI